MKARTELFATYAEWRRWTEIEGAAIEAANWPRVQECQDAKHQLRPRIITGNDDARQECTRLGLNLADMDQDVRKVIAELITLETRNGEVLALKRQETENQRAELECTHRNLRRIRRSYGAARDTVWSSLS
jgi:hypothetical protein